MGNFWLECKLKYVFSSDYLKLKLLIRKGKEKETSFKISLCHFTITNFPESDFLI
jgi:hypothetical protein